MIVEQWYDTQKAGTVVARNCTEVSLTDVHLQRVNVEKVKTLCVKNCRTKTVVAKRVKRVDLLKCHSLERVEFVDVEKVYAQCYSLKRLSGFAGVTKRARVEHSVIEPCRLQRLAGVARGNITLIRHPKSPWCNSIVEKLTKGVYRVYIDGEMFQ